MALRWSIILLGSLIVAGAGGMISAAPIIRAAVLGAPVAEAPTPELEAARLSVTGEMQRTVGGLSRRAGQLELLSDLLADAAEENAAGRASTVSYPGAPAAR